ncbi:MAG: metal-dependent transcriptional regulator [Candidatus Methanomethyliaceae archaeon]|nr:metal-dependent transcriptional regulator [Candidatus Methanomethyliaceae archaeon]MCX8169707.1 metal-dependent transcriptional regulator [Candidatus Methanomethyliaceae archaeon]MDW7971390.1 metal-dependent transcriptional regulator [Nitrososphaerota archaeon]
MKHTKNIEDYLEVIYIISEEKKIDPVRTKDLAKRLEVYPSTVSEMIKKLIEMKLVVKVGHGSIKLTDSGRERARRVLKNHRLLECFFYQYLGINNNKAKNTICKIEHHINEEIFNVLYEKLGRPKSCPHGNPIPI